MVHTYNIKQARTILPGLCRSGKRFVISNRTRPVVVALPIDDFDAVLETMDLLADRAAVKALSAAGKGKATCREINLDDENFGL